MDVQVSHAHRRADGQPLPLKDRREIVVEAAPDLLAGRLHVKIDVVGNRLSACRVVGHGKAAQVKQVLFKDLRGRELRGVQCRVKPGDIIDGRDRKMGVLQEPDDLFEPRQVVRLLRDVVRRVEFIRPLSAEPERAGDSRVVWVPPSAGESRPLRDDVPLGSQVKRVIVVRRRCEWGSA